MTLARILMRLVRNGDVEIGVGKYWADIALVNGKYWNVGFKDERAVKDFLNMVKSYKTTDDEESEFDVDGIYKIGKRTVYIYHYYPYTV